MIAVYDGFAQCCVGNCDICKGLGGGLELQCDWDNINAILICNPGRDQFEQVIVDLKRSHDWSGFWSDPTYLCCFVVSGFLHTPMICKQKQETEHSSAVQQPTIYVMYQENSTWQVPKLSFFSAVPCCVHL